MENLTIEIRLFITLCVCSILCSILGMHVAVPYLHLCALVLCLHVCALVFWVIGYYQAMSRYNIRYLTGTTET
jgi:hypothetical protein